MRTLEQWFEEYAISHQNHTNKRIHYICVPAIYFSVIGLLYSVKIPFLHLNINLLETLATPILALVLLFYFRISSAMALKMMVFSISCLLLNSYIAKYLNLPIFSVIVFVIAWIGQFYGHKIEGKKPSFLKDLQFLMIGPAWVIENLLTKK